MSRLGRVVALVAALGLVGEPALASKPASSGDATSARQKRPPVRLGVLPTLVLGTEADEVRVRVRSEVDGALAHGEFERVDLEVEAPAQPDAYCVDAMCWQYLSGQHEVTHLLQLVVTFEDPDWRIQAVIVDGEAGQEIAQASRTCDLCGFDELTGAVADVTAGARRKLEASMVLPPLLRVESTPPGAMVTIDDEPAGKTPVEVTLEAGQHEILVSQDGFITERRQVAMVDGVQHAVNVSLRPLLESNPETPASEAGKGLQIGGAVSLAIGVALVGVGAGLLAIDSKPIDRECTGANVDPNGNCKYLHNTLGSGIGMLAGGGALTVAGITMVVIGSKRRKRTAEVQATLGGLRGRF